MSRTPKAPDNSSKSSINSGWGEDSKTFSGGSFCNCQSLIKYEKSSWFSGLGNCCIGSAEENLSPPAQLSDFGERFAGTYRNLKSNYCSPVDETLFVVVYTALTVDSGAWQNIHGSHHHCRPSAGVLLIDSTMFRIFLRLNHWS